MMDTEPGSAQSRLDDAELTRLVTRLRRFAIVVAPAEVGGDDLLQEAFERFFSGDRAHVLDIEAYLRQTLTRLASNHRRRLGRFRRVLARVAQHDNTRGDDAYPSDIAFLEVLSPRERAVLYLQEVEGLSVDAIASQLNASASAVKQAGFRARHRIRHHLEQESSS